MSSNPHLGLNDLFLAILLASKTLNVRLRPELKAGENFSAEDDVEEAIASGAAATEPGLLSLMIKMRSSMPPQALLEDIVTTVQDPFLGLEALALASICERSELTPKLEQLPRFQVLPRPRKARSPLRGHGCAAGAILDSGWPACLPPGGIDRKRKA